MVPPLAVTTLGNPCVGKRLRRDLAAPGGGLKVFVTDRDNFATATTASSGFWAVFSGNAAGFAPFAEAMATGRLWLGRLFRRSAEHAALTKIKDRGG